MSSSPAATASRQAIWLKMIIERRQRHYATRSLRATQRQDPASIFTLVATAADALEDQDTLAYGHH